MSDNSNISFEKLRALVEGRLSNKESEQLIALLEKDEESKAIYDGLVSFIENESITIDEFVEKTHQQIFEQQKKEKKNESRRVLIYSTIAVAASIIAYIFILKNSTDFSDFDFQDAGLAVTLDSKSSQLNESMNAYKLGNFKRADSIISSLLVEDRKNDTLLYYKAVNQKQIENYDSAAKYFVQINSSSEFFEKAEYQLAICKLYLDKIEDARQILMKISNNRSHDFQTEAEKLLSEIKA